MIYKVICCVGDSVANGYWDKRGLGWFGRLQEAVAAKYPFKFGFNNLAQSGDRTVDTYYRLCSDALARHPDILIIAVGKNDLIRWGAPDAPTDQSPQATAEYWERLLEVARVSVPKVLVLGLLPAVEARCPTTGWDGQTPAWKFNADRTALDSQIAQWCQAAGVEYLPMFDVFGTGDISGFYYDSAHPNDQGHALMCARVFEKLEALGWVGSGA